MKDNFDKSLARVLVYEGGYVNDPRDPGGETNKGITHSTYAAYRAREGLGAGSVRNITMGEVQAIYKSMYWDRIRGDQLPAGVDFCMFDAAVNSGVGGAASWAQAVLKLVVDGDFGEKTLQGILGDDPEDFIRDFCSHRLGSLMRLRTWSRFGKGWHARIANVQKAALAMAEQGIEPEAAPVSLIGGNAKNHLEDIPVSNTGVIITHASTVGGMVATGAAQTAQSLSAASDAFAWMKYVLGGLTILGAIGGTLVYLAKAANDAASNGLAKAKVNPDADTEIVPVPLASGPAVIKAGA